MTLVFLHGPPATGKFTVGRELATITGYRFFHNHLVVDALLAVFDFGTPAFVELRETIWREVFARAIRERVAGVIFTFSPENTVRQEFLDWVFTGPPARDGRVFSVSLSARESEIEQRIAAPSRRGTGKLTDLDLYRRLRESGAFRSPVVPRTDLAIDTGEADAVSTARRIAAALRVGVK